MEEHQPTGDNYGQAGQLQAGEIAVEISPELAAFGAYVESIFRG